MGLSALPYSLVVRVEDGTAVGQARRAARELARELRLPEVLSEQAAIVASEASRNVLLHAGRGDLLLSAGAGGGSIDVLALDRGPGIPDLGKAMRDGYSTSGTAGQGLGAIARIASVMDVYSAPGGGTALYARVGAKAPRGPLQIGAVCAAMSFEERPGDAWAEASPGGRPVVLVADGLGHGARAAEAAGAAVEAFRKHAALPADRLVEQLHLALRPTRGAAVAVAEVVAPDRLRFAAVGNISAGLWGSGKVRKMVSLPGTAGHHARSIRAYEYEWPEEGLLIMHTDGIATHWALEGYPGLWAREPSLVAGVLFRDFARDRDDATIVVARRTEP